MSTTIKRAVITGAIVAGLALGGTGIAVASANPAVSSGADSGTNDHDPSFTGTVPAPAGAAGAGNETAGDETAREEAAAKALQSFATTTSAEATAAALKVVPGTAGTALLESENGYVVYGIEVTKADGTVVDVKVDAGNGKVLAQEIDSETNDD